MQSFIEFGWYFKLLIIFVRLGDVSSMVSDQWWKVYLLKKRLLEAAKLK